MTKSEENKRHYAKHKDSIKARRREKLVESKKQKTFSELMTELSTSAQRAKAQFIIEQTPTELLETNKQEIALGFESLVRQESLTESETLQIKKNKRLVQRWQMFLKALEQHVNQAIDKRIDKRLK
jgi:hypothetical protein